MIGRIKYFGKVIDISYNMIDNYNIEFIHRGIKWQAPWESLIKEK